MSCTALQEQNVQVAAGIIGAPPVPKGATAFQYTVSTQGRLTDEKEFGDIIVKTGANGQVTRVRDIARVELAARDYTVNSRLGGKPATAIAIYQLPGSNALATSDAVRKKMAELKQRFPDRPRLHNCLRPDRFCPRVDPRSAEDAFRGNRAGRSRRLDLSPNLARGDHSAHRDSGFVDRHVRGDERLSDSRSTTSRFSASSLRSASWSMTPSWSSKQSSITLKMV